MKVGSCIYQQFKFKLQAQMIDKSKTCSNTFYPRHSDQQSIWTELHKLKKQLKKKVDRHQFTTAMSSKLSLSEISQLTKNPQHQFYNKENEHIIINKKPTEIQFNLPTYQFQQHKTFTKFQQKYAEMIFVIDDKVAVLDQELADLREEIRVMRERSTGAEIDNKQQDKKQLQQKMKVSEGHRKVSQLEAAVYKKADRTELDKLFNLNDLLVIELQQIKESCKQEHHRFKTKISNLEGQTTHRFYNQGIQQKQQSERTISRLSSKVDHNQSDLKQFKEEVMGMIRQRDTMQQSYKNIRQDHDRYLEEFRKEVSSYSFQMRQLSTRVNILELKENQITKAAKQFDDIKNNIETFRIDLQTINNRTDYLSETTKEYCKMSLASFTKEIYGKVENQLGQSCDMLTQKIVKMLETSISKEEYEQQYSKMYDKLKRIVERQNILSHRVEQLVLKFEQSQELGEQQAQNNQQRFSRISEQIQTSLKSLKNQLYQILSKKYINDEQLTEVIVKLDEKINQDIKQRYKQQERVNEVLCSENIVGKWVWQCGKFCGGNLVNWDKQLTNTLPQNYRWQQNHQPAIINIDTNGFYRIEVGFFAKKKPTVQLIMNGKTIISAVNSNSYVLHHSSGRLKEVGNSKEVVGLTFIEYLMVRQPSRLAISYSGEHAGEGFITIHRL